MTCLLFRGSGEGVLRIIGHTGSGKSTLMQQLNGLLEAHLRHGAARPAGHLVGQEAGTGEARFRVGLVFQYPEYQLFEETVYKDIAFGPKNMGLSAGGSRSPRPRKRPGFVGAYGSSSWRFHPLTFPAGRSAGSPLRA